MTAVRLADKALDTAQVALGIRIWTLRKALELDGGYVSQGLSSAEILASLYTRLLNIGPSLAPPLPLPFGGTPSAHNPGHRSGDLYNGARSSHFDRFIFSPTHYSLALYATLVEVGRLDPTAMDLVEVDGAVMERIGAEHSPGIAITSGSFGQSLSQAAGIAYARRVNGETGHTWIFISDGELQEGQTWEAVAACGFHKLDNLTVIIDANGQQVDGPIDAGMQTEPIGGRLAAFGANVLEIDGHDLNALANIPHHRKAGSTLFVIARTDPMREVPELAPRMPELHYVIVSDEEERARLTGRLVKLQERVA